MNLQQAQRYADQIVEWLSPFCHRMEIVGSIRRRRPVCNDVDLVCIPKTSSETKQVDLLSTEQVVTNRLRQFLTGYVRKTGDAQWLGRNGQPGTEPKPDAINLLVQLRACQLDIFCATEQTWATLKLCRTGSKEHNIWLADRANDYGGHWNPYKGLKLPHGLITAISEEEIYAALKLPFIRPEDRELPYLRKLS